jgi:DNA-binding HxlR family transcriptional regulator
VLYLGASMRREAPLPRPTSVQRTGAIFQEPWASLVLREAFFGVKRYEEFQRNLGVSRPVLARRLRSLVDRGILERSLYQTKPDRYEYRLTEAGLEMYPIFLAMKAWGDKWLGGDGEPIVLRHEKCGKSSRPAMTCDRCGEPVQARDMSYYVKGTR